MQLTKHHGLGNDFLVVLDEVNGRALKVDGELARKVCDRRTGIGADGLIHGAAPEPGSDADVVMHLYNADGSRAETSGNGIRCLAHAIALAREVNELTVLVDTDAGRRKVVIGATDQDDRTALAHAYMGKVIPGPEVPAVGRGPSGRGRTGPGGSLRVGRCRQPPSRRRGRRIPSKVDLADIGAWIDQQFPERHQRGVRGRPPATCSSPTCGSEARASPTPVARARVRWRGCTPRSGATPAGDDEIDVRMPGGDAHGRDCRRTAPCCPGRCTYVATIELPDV